MYCGLFVIGFLSSKRRQNSGSLSEVWENFANTCVESRLSSRGGAPTGYLSHCCNHYLLYICTHRLILRTVLWWHCGTMPRQNQHTTAYSLVKASGWRSWLTQFEIFKCVNRQILQRPLLLCSTSLI